MNLIDPTSASRTSAHDPLFAQGADLIAEASEGPLLRAGLWFKNTPTHDGETIGAIGGCQLGQTSSPRAVTFLRDCAHYLHHTQHCKTVIGPMNGNTWLKHRLIIESDDRPPFLMEPIELDHFFNTFQDAGFSVLSQYSSAVIDLTSVQPDFSSLENRFRKRGITIRPINPKSFKSDLINIYQLSLICFAHNFLYTPIDESTFIGTYEASQQHIDPKMVMLAERTAEKDNPNDPDSSQLVGYVFCIPDLAAVQRNEPPAIIVKTLAVLPESPFAGLGTVLVGKAHQQAKDLGYQEAIHALQHENNTSHRISQRFNAQIFRRYALMKSSFQNPS